MDGDLKPAYHLVKSACLVCEDEEKCGCSVGILRHTHNPNYAGRLGDVFELCPLSDVHLVCVDLLCCIISATCELSLSSQDLTLLSHEIYMHEKINLSLLSVGPLPSQHAY